MAVAAGSHFHTFQGLFTRMPIKKTTKPPSISAQTRLPTIRLMRSPAYGQISAKDVAPHVAKEEIYVIWPSPI